jgi:hypothetical protein
MPTWCAVAWGIAASALLALLGVRFLLGERRLGVLVASAASALVAPLGFGPLRADPGRRVALTSLICGPRRAAR